MDSKEIYKALSKQGLQSRQTQIDMIEGVQQAISKHQFLCVEAPTGTGKTLAYLLGALSAKGDGQHIVVSTATIALQEQLIKKDIPLLQKILGTEIKWAIAKGRRRYVCHARVFQHFVQETLFTSQKHMDYLKKLLETQLWDGDRDRLDRYIPDADWQTVSTDSAGCSGKRCEFFEDCAYYKAKKNVYSADVIISNHNILLSDIELGSGVLLPPFEENIYIIDECHHLPSKALSQFSRTISFSQTYEWLSTLNKQMLSATTEFKIESSAKSNISQHTDNLVKLLKQIKMYLDGQSLRFSQGIWHLLQDDDTINENAKYVLTEAKVIYSQLDRVTTSLNDLYEQNKKSDKDKAEAINSRLVVLDFLQGRLMLFLETWQLYCHERQPKEPPIAKWFEHLSDRDDYRCCASPINISHKLQTMFWNRIKTSCILCSATIQSLGSFESYLRKTGLKQYEHTKTVVIPPTFEYQNSTLYIPQMQHEPSGKGQPLHLDEAANIIAKLLQIKLGTLVLFTSGNAMQQTFHTMPSNIAADILMQGEQSKAKLLDQHETRIDNNERSILFGLASFAEGLDLPGKLCEHVIIHKLPFSVPTNPIELTREAWLKQNNLNGFMLSSLPEACIKLTQYTGRLIRHEEDQGIITILDKRLLTKRYGKQLLDSLPNFKRLTNLPISDLITNLE